MPEPLPKVANLVKRFGKITDVDGPSLDVCPGEAIGPHLISAELTVRDRIALN